MTCRELWAQLPFPWGQERDLPPTHHPQSLSPQSSPGKEAGGRQQHPANLRVLETEAWGIIAAHPK